MTEQQQPSYLRAVPLAAPDPDLQPLTCEHCGSATHESGDPLLKGNAWSIHAYIATTGGEPHPGAGRLSGGPNECGCPTVQHFACSLACAVAAHQQCLAEHIAPMVAAKRATMKQARVDALARDAARNQPAELAQE